MEKDPLTTILDEERLILEQLAAERSRANERLAQLRLEAEAEYAREEERLAAALQQALATARSDAEKRAAAVITEANQLAERLRRLDDESLLAITLKHLKAILPGRSDDRQNVPH